MQASLLTDAEIEKLRPGSTRPWNPAAALGYVTGLAGGEWHAVSPSARARPPRAQATGGKPVVVRAVPAAYDRLALPVAARPCRECAWQMAIRTGSTGRELALLAPSAAEAAAITRSGADPVLAGLVIHAILRGEDGGEDGLDSPVVAQLLALTTSHRPVLYSCEACSDGESGECDGGCAEACCGACTPRAGPWAGEWEGTSLPGLLITAPCSVLTALASRYDITVR